MASSSVANVPIQPKAAKRIQRELVEFQTSPPPFVPKIAVDDTNMRHIYFLIVGPDDSPYKGGEYVLRVELPLTYPMAAPVIRMLTPSGRFEVGKSICTTFTHYHPETWCPTYNFTNIMVSFVSFMLDTANPSSIGSIVTSNEEKMLLAEKSKEWNKRHGYDVKFA